MSELKKLAPKPRWGFVKIIYETLLHYGPMTTKELERITGIAQPSLSRALINGMYRGYLNASKDGGLYSIATKDVFESKGDNRNRQDKKVRQLRLVTDRTPTSKRVERRINAEPGPVAVARLNRLVDEFKKTNPKADQNSVLRKALFELEHKFFQEAVAPTKKPKAGEIRWLEVEKPKPWWKLW